MQFREHRYPTRHEARLITKAGEVRARVINMHRAGARIAFEPGPLALSSEVHLAMGGQTYAADVVWTNGRTLGLRFAEPLSRDRLAMFARIRQPRGGKKTRHLMPGTPQPRFAPAMRSTPIWENRSM